MRQYLKHALIKGSLVPLAFTSMCLLAACNVTQDVVHLERYTLTLDVSPAVYHNESYAVDVKLAPILSQGGIVMQLSEVALRPAKNYRYSSRLDEELRYLMIDECLKAELSSRYSFKIYVSKFQSTLAGAVIVQFQAQVKDKRRRNRVVLEQTFEKQSTLTTDGYPAVVTELKQNYLSLVRSMIEDLQSIKKR